MHRNESVIINTCLIATNILTATPSSSSTGAAIGGAAGGVIVLLIIIVVVILLRRRTRKLRPISKSQSRGMEMEGLYCTIMLHNQ